MTEWERTKILTSDLEVPLVFPLQVCFPAEWKIGVQHGDGHSHSATSKDRVHSKNLNGLVFPLPFFTTLTLYDVPNSPTVFPSRPISTYPEPRNLHSYASAVSASRRPPVITSFRPLKLATTHPILPIHTIADWSWIPDEAMISLRGR